MEKYITDQTFGNMRTPIYILALFIAEAIEKAGHVYVKASEKDIKVLGWIFAVFAVMDLLEWTHKIFLKKNS